ncbi:hypothetical protein [Micromonospora halophytica]|uniref:Uncharacterized protein n=1 Tax=Micromonospora halophytica TaxID=47864 RepID=A0A1C5GNP3_9ACTN|nr:hypothetical protein [Micromonospora halophytica]SCG35399.1 hypothetical protein GA0070560_101434 [Micromonospora halophytica]
MAKKRTAPSRRTQAKGAKIVSAHLENADVFRTAKAAGTTPRGPAVLVLRNRPDFDKRDFDRKARDLVRLGREGRLSKAKSDRTANNVYHRGGRGTKPGTRTRTNVFRDRVIRRLTKNERLTQQHGTPETNQYVANKGLVDRLYDGRGPITARGQGLDPDHVHELQLDGKDEYANLRLMDAWTNRQIGSDISVALRDVPEGTPIIVKVLP